MPNSPRYSVLLTRDDSYIWPWRASLRDSWQEYDNGEIEFSRGHNAAEALDRLQVKLRFYQMLTPEIIMALDNVSIDYSERTLTVVGNYSEGMSFDESPSHDDENDNRHVSRLCAKCHISSAKYPNGDDSQIEIHLNRYGIKQLLCFTCRLEEHLAKLKADKRLTAGMADSDAPWPFERWLAPGDMIRAHSLGVELVGHLPTITTETMAECRNEMERSYF